MPRIEATVSCPVHDSFRVQQVAGLFDLPLEAKATRSFAVELPGLDEPWDVGLIVGPSGSGKSTVASRAYGAELYRGGEWRPDRAVIDGFGELPMRQTVELLTAVGFSSPPSWIKPYHVLSGGERFRCDLARALGGIVRRVENPVTSTSGRRPVCGTDAGRLAPLDVTEGVDVTERIDVTDGVAATGPVAAELAPRASHPAPLVVFDEYTSVVDRNVARACSAAIGKGIRRGTIPARFVAVTCHYDVAEWLEADWVLDMATGLLQRRRLRRPAIELEIHRSTVAAWRLFAPHHYLSGSLAPAARCYLATWQGEPVTFCATLPMIARRHHRRFTRIVTLPDYQGMGIGMRVVAAVAALHRAEGLRVNVTSSHPALIRHCQASADWKTVNVRRACGRRRSAGFAGYRSAGDRAVASFEYVGAS